MDLTKRNLHKLLHYVIDLGYSIDLKIKVLSKLLKQVKKAYTKLDKNNVSNMAIVEFIIFTIKTLEDCIKKVDDGSELANIILKLKN
jgi:hypothetical protein